uniref:Glutathione transferase n=1 Tax=Eutreptiella gymnastica TaxID=73025 RepID=A0A7S4LLV6_9EUGL
MVFISSPRGDHCLRMGCSPCPHNVALCSQSAMLGVAVGATLGIIVAMLGTTGVPTTDLATVSPVTSRGALRVGSYASGQYPRPFLRSPQDAVLPPLHAVEDERADMESLAQGEQPPVDSVSRISRVASPFVAAGLVLVALCAFVAGRLLGRPPHHSDSRVALLSTTGESTGPSLEIFGSRGSRSPLINWYLYEIGVDFNDVDIASVDRSGPAYPHPFGKIPACRDGPLAVFESGAILMYIADKYGGLDTPEKRAAAGSWVVWANATLDPICFIENDRGQVLDTQLRKQPPAIDTLNAILGSQPWVLGDEFSVADVAVASYLLYVLLFFPDVSVAKWPHVAKYMETCALRPAYARAFGDDVAQVLAQRSRAGPAPKKKFGGLF